ncbi:MAG: hypothetical protein IMX01_07200 [Limnochordaceae bacterium]|nr:hypothetical protein [Limnochordaceae bacterium]
MVRWGHTIRTVSVTVAMGLMVMSASLTTAAPGASAAGDVSGSVAVQAKSGVALRDGGVRFGAGLLLWPLPVDLGAVNGQLATSGQPYTALTGRNWALGVHGEMLVGPWQLGLLNGTSVVSAGSGAEASSLTVQLRGMQALYDLNDVAGALSSVTGAPQLRVAGGLTLGYGWAELRTGAGANAAGRTHFRLVIPEVVVSLPVGTWSELQLSLGYLKPTWMRGEGAPALQPSVASLQGWTMGGGVGIRF